MICEIHKHKFYTKKEISEKCRTILSQNINNYLDEEDFAFIYELIGTYYPYPDSKKLWDVQNMIVRLRSGITPCLNVIDSDGHEREVSYEKAIKHIIFKEDDEILDVFKFGRYKDHLISDVIKQDPNYIEWLLKQTWLDKTLRNKILETINK